ncbi:MAG TPA: TonB-dependent receptor [Rhodanobacteraceae bacterium]|nr:TonB-dependent receptor [Rhodanobacteraceae bacterium]
MAAVRVDGAAAASGSHALAQLERRHAGAVTEVLGAESMSANGDSDAAAALKRVTGLSLVDSQYVYVRGLGERYSSVLLNGARVPSPDPTRRVVPLDLFPTAVLDSALIHKSTSAEQPGHFGGGTVHLRTRRYPLDFTASLGIVGKYDSRATAENGLTHDGGQRDWTGFGVGGRELPPILRPGASGRPIAATSPLNPDGLSAAELEQLGEQVASGSGYRADRGRLDPGAGISASIGDSWALGADGRIGFLAALRHESMWDRHAEQRATYAASNDGLQQADALAVDVSRQAIDASGFFSAGVDFGAGQQLGLTHMLLRQSEDEVKLARGESENQLLERYQLRWVENRLRWDQLTGSHALPGYATLEWQFADARAERDEPNTRRWRRDDDDRDGDYAFSDRTDSNSQTAAQLADDVRDWSVRVSLPVDFSADVSTQFALGRAVLSRQRDARMRTFAFDGELAPALSPLPQDALLTPDTIGPGGLVLEETTLPTDNYRATQSLDAWYVEVDTSVAATWRLLLGLRAEHDRQHVVTADPTNPTAAPVRAHIDRRDLLPSLALTWSPDERNQWRLAYASSLSRPDFRELSPAPFLDPQLDLITVGNPRLKTTTIRHLDLRWEHYFSEQESASIGVFHKHFENPIEKTFSAGGSTQFINLRNALSARVYGVELDWQKSLAAATDWPGFGRLPLAWDNYYLAANYARIESRVTLDPAATSQTRSRRPLQGASPYVANLRLGWRGDPRGSSWALLFNMSGERIARAGVAGQPDVYEQALPQLDFVYRLDVGAHADWRLKLGNLLDSAVEYRQGEETTRRYHKGRRIDIGFTWRF